MARTAETDAGEIVQQVVFIRCADLARACAFYGGLLAFEQVLDQGPCRIFRTAGEAFLGLCEGRPAPQNPGAPILTFVTPDVDGWHRRLVAAGAAVRGAPARNSTYNVYNFFAEDPDGHLIEFQRFLDPAWPAPGPTQQKGKQ